MRSLRDLISFTVVLCLASISTDPADGFQAENSDRNAAGLPSSQRVQPIYSEELNHDLNQLHHLIFVTSIVPEEIHASLPRERQRSGISDEEFYKPGWYFSKRPGNESDRTLFGGDVRITPRSSFDRPESETLRELLQRIGTHSDPRTSKILEDPLVRLMVQWDLLSTWWSLERAESTDVPLLEAFAQAIVGLGQKSETLRSLPSGLENLGTQFAHSQLREVDKPYFPKDFSLTAKASEESTWIEVGRKSSALFRADRALRVTRTYLNAGAPSITKEIIQASGMGNNQSISIPPETQTLLVFQLIGIDDQLQPIATQVVDEVRVRALHGPAILESKNLSNSRDGSNHWIYHRTRYGTVYASKDDFRFVPGSNESLFLEYGTKKHATYSAQCALCHRRTHNGGQSAEGIRILSKYAEPHEANDEERANLALQEMSPVLEKLKKRLPQSKVSTSDAASPTETENESESPPTAMQRLKPRPERSQEQRNAWVSELRKLYETPPEKWPRPNVDPNVRWNEIGLLPKLEHPADNPFSKAKEKLGKTLFFDPRLSGSRQIACASCHDPDLGWADGRTTSFGHGRTLLRRNAPTIRNAGHFAMLFWDGRSSSLEDQAIQVLENPSEMKTSEASVIATLSSSEAYRTMFLDAFGDDSISYQRVAQAIACFERTIVGGSSRFDAFMKGRKEIYSDSELIGLDLFRRDARCMNCHHGPLFSDGGLHDVGLSYYQRKFEDLGRFGVSGRNEDIGRFRTPSLRNITQTSPLMHNGLFELPGVLNMYNAGMPTLRRKEHQQDDPRFPVKSPHLKPLGLNKEDLNDLATFLKTLEEPKRRIWPPDLPPLGESIREP